jgi:salicylate hydroxylase
MAMAFSRPKELLVSKSMHVLIIGGGIGGLTLAQGLKREGVSATVYERDRTPTDRLQGYRVHINRSGSLGLHECLPQHLFDVFDRTCGSRIRAVHFFTEHMHTLLEFNGELIDRADVVARHRHANRLTLRQVLLEGLDNVQFGKMFVRYAECGARVVAHFADGSTAEGDLLVAADGGGSRVRKQFLPHAERIDTGVIGIGGKIFLDTARERIAPPLLDGISFIAARGGFGLFVALQDMVSGPIGRFSENGAALADAGNDFENTRSYLMWGLSAKCERFGLADRERADANALAGAAERSMSGWSRAFRDLVGLSDPTMISLLTIRTSVPVAAWRTGRITLLGDAIHSMTPFRGIGANVAVRDATRLKRALVAAARGERSLTEAIHEYETGMLDYGFRAVKNSLTAMQRTLAEGAPALTMSRLALRTINALPFLKRRFAERWGEE